MVSFLIHAVSLEPRRSTRACFGKFLAGKFLQSTAATQRFKSKTGNQKRAKNHGQFSHSRCFVRTCRSKGLLWKTFLRGTLCKAQAPRSISKERRRTKNDQKSWEVFSFALFRRALSFEGLAWKNFSRENFCKSQAPRSVSEERRWTKNERKSWEVFSFALFRPNLSFKRLAWKHFSRENFCKAQAPRSVSKERRRTKNEQKSWEVFSFALFRPNLSFEGLAWKHFSRENFCKAQAPRSVSKERRRTKNEQKSWEVPGFVPRTGLNAAERWIQIKKEKIKISARVSPSFMSKNHPLGWWNFVNLLIYLLLTSSWEKESDLVTSLLNCKLTGSCVTLHCWYLRLKQRHVWSRPESGVWEKFVNLLLYILLASSCEKFSLSLTSYIYMLYMFSQDMLIFLPFQRYAATFVVRRAVLENFPKKTYTQKMSEKNIKNHDFKISSLAKK